MAEGLINTREVANNIADLSGIIKNKAYRGSVRGNISNITTNNLVIGTHGNIVEALNLVSQSAHGRMSKEDKKKLDSIESGSNKYIHPDTHPASMITEDAAKRFVSQAMVDGWNADIANRYTKAEIDNKISGLLQNIDWKESVDTFADLATTYPNPQDGWTVNVKDTDITYRWSGTEWTAISLNALPMATQTVDGKMSKEDKAKLDGIALNANNYVHPNSHSATMITEDATHRFVSDTEKSTWNNKANASHGNHVPTTETANNARFLRNDNTWQAVTPGNIGAYTKAEVDAGWTAGTRDNWYLKNTLGVMGDVNTVFKYGKTGFFCGDSLINQMPWGTHSWKHYITMSHANTAGYTGIIGMNFDGDEIGFKAISHGADKGWKRIWHSGNFTPDTKGSVTKTLSITAKVWTDTGIKLATGTYIIQVLVNDVGAGGSQYAERYSGIMSSYDAGTNSTVITEIPLTNAGHAPNGQFICLGFKRAGGNTGAQCLVITGTTTTKNASYTFSYRKVL